MIKMKPDVKAFPLSEGYLLVDSKKCQGCLSCMMVCSLVHEGAASLSLSRIQVMQNILKKWPDDIKIAQCRQCANPFCVRACPTGALYVDPANGNVRVIDESKCDGCQKCITACPFLPQRIMWNPETRKAIKCDLCLNTPYRSKKGGPDGSQACVEICPQQVIKFTRKAPKQQDDSGYDLELHEEAVK
jgi:protein NrfC